MSKYGIFLNQKTSQQVGISLRKYLEYRNITYSGKHTLAENFNLKTSQMPFGGMFSFYTRYGVHVVDIIQEEGDDLTVIEHWINDKDINKQYTEQEIRDFYEKMYSKDSDGCYNACSSTWDTMIKQNPKLCIDLEVKRQMKEALDLDKRPPTTEYVKKKEGVDWFYYFNGLLMVLVLGLFVYALIVLE